MIWKERNRQIFQGRKLTKEKIRDREIQLLRETILGEDWCAEDWKTDFTGNNILKKLNLSYEMTRQNQSNRQSKGNQASEKFKYPKPNFIKLNFDGASKGNPGQAGFGGIFRDSKKNTRWIYAEGGGEMTNNEAELWAIHEGLSIAIRNGYTNMEIEGDSMMTIEILRKLDNGKSWEHVTNSWRTSGIVQDIAELLKIIGYKTFSHIKRKGNSAADFLANRGCKNQETKTDCQWEAVKSNEEWSELNSIIQNDHAQSNN